MADSINSSLDLTQFKFTKVLGNFTFSKKIHIQGTFGDKNEDAIVILEKIPFTEGDLPGILKVSHPSELYFQNDIYLSLCHFPAIDFTGLKTTIIAPASEQIIQKYTPESNCLVDETYESHILITKLHIKAKYPDPQWVYNILDHKAETDRIVFEDPDKSTGFILLPDLKWDGKTPGALYVQALPHIRGLQTIRDLTADHLPLLRNIAQQAPKAIEEKYNIPHSQLLAYFHYLPSYYHIHIHFKLINSEGNASTGCERAHLLSTVIGNIEIASDYYQKVTLPISLKNSDTLVEKIRNGVINTSGSSPTS